MKESHDNKILVSNIQRFCTKDGPGIRTTVFLMGCHYHCPWCSNPENLTPKIKEYVNEYGHLMTIGRYYSVDELYKEIMKDAWVFKKGGVTFSGGEPLLWGDELFDLIQRLNKTHVNVAFETALGCENDDIENILPYVDYFIIDIKTLDKNTAREIFGYNVDNYIKAFEKITRLKKCLVRMPIAEGVNDSVTCIGIVIALLRKQHIGRIQIFGIHNLGEKKYKVLNMRLPTITNTSDDVLYRVKSQFDSQGISCEILNI